MSKSRRKTRPNRPAEPTRSLPRGPVPDAGATDEEVVLSPVVRDPAVWVGLALVALTVAVFAAVRHFDFIRLDDPGYVNHNAHVTGGLTWRGIVWAWTTGHAANWHPLTWMSHMLDATLFGVRPGGHHLMSLLIHVVNTVLLFTLLRRATGTLARAAFVAALFAVHPLHVESVAWIAERKDVLSTMFWLLTMIGYVAYVREPRWDRYLLVCAGMALGLLAKPMLVTLPLVLLLFDVWPLGRSPLSPKRADRLGWPDLVREKMPLFALAAASSIITFLVQRRGGAMTGLDLLPLSTRLGNAVVAYVRYLGKMAWPAKLTLFYPYSEALPAWWIVGSLVALLAISVIALRGARRFPYLFVGWFWYVGTLVPVIGIVQVGTQAIADRYTYVPLIGIFIALAWGAVELTARWPARRFLLPAAAGIIVVLCAVTARAQVAVWQSNWTVWSHALDVTEGNYIAENAIGIMLAEESRHDEAFAHFQASLRFKPEYAPAHNNMGLAYTRQGRSADALSEFSLAVRLMPELAEAQNNFGFALMGSGRTDEALVHYREAVRLDPAYVSAHNNLGFLLAAARRMNEALPHLEEAVRLDPNSETAHMYLGMAYSAIGKLDDAAVQFREVKRINPQNTDVQSAIDSLDAARKKGPGRGGD